jgi:hypothetical protein
MSANAVVATVLLTGGGSRLLAFYRDHRRAAEYFSGVKAEELTF